MAVSTAPKTWVYDDLFALPDDGRRYEIIEGTLYEMPTPGSNHAQVIINLILLLGPLVRALGGKIFTAPFAVFFAGADPVRPDIIVVLPGGGATVVKRGAEGARDLLIEIISPSNRVHDVLTKRALYARAGVREYWIVDPVAQTIEVLALDRDAFHSSSILHREEAMVSAVLPAATFSASDVFDGLVAEEEPGDLARAANL